jgi:DnaJ-class molecular chaperone
MSISPLQILLAFAVVIALAWAAGKDYYKILNVQKSASAADIKRAYRKLSLKYHPDKNPSPDAAQKFSEIAQAYDVLSDPEKREVYNRGGEEAVKQQEQRANQPAADPFNIFEHFGFGGFGGGRQHVEEQRTPNVEIPIRVTLKQLYLGELLDVEYTRQVVCVEASSCEKKNQDCQGPGIKLRVQQLAPGFVQQIQVSDPSCVARGKAWKSPCKACPKGMTEEEEIQLTVDIQAGMRDGDKIKFDQVADEAVGHTPGDLIFVVRQINDPRFLRDGDDLRTMITITLEESLVGFEKFIDHVDGHRVKVAKEDVSVCGDVVKVTGEGMPKRGSKNSRGDLYVDLSIQFPKALSIQQKNLIRQALSMRV